MKLFTPRESVLLSQAKKDDELAQISYLETTLATLQRQINVEKNAFDKQLENQRTVYGDAKNKLQQEIKDLEDKLQTLRKERRELLIPVNDLKKQAELALQEAKDHKVAISIKEGTLDDLILNTQAKLDNLAERECIISREESELFQKKQGINEEAIKVSEGHKKLNAMLLEFNADMEKRSKSIAEKEDSLRIRELALMQMVEERNKYFDSLDRAFKDKYATLERSFNELKRKQNGNNK